MTGKLTIETRAAQDSVPIMGTIITVSDIHKNVLHVLETDGSGRTETITLDAPPKENSQNPNNPGPFYSEYIVEANEAKFLPITVDKIQVYDGQESILPISMLPKPNRGSGNPIVYNIPKNALENPVKRDNAHKENYVLPYVAIPHYITVHLGRPTSSAQNVTVPFIDYIKNVASSEIYPTWPKESLRANIHCQISLTLNRIYTEWYRSRGYLLVKVIPC